MRQKNVILITGASSGFGALAARALAKSGHIVFAGIRGTKARNAQAVSAASDFAQLQQVDLRTIELDVQDETSITAAVSDIIDRCGRIDVVIHNAGHMSFGPAEAFTPAQLAELYDVNVLSTHRLNRAVLPHMRAERSGLLIWVSSSSARGGTPPFLAPYFAAKAAMDSLAVSYAAELTLWNIETSIVVPGAFTKGTNHFISAGKPEDAKIAAEYQTGPYRGIAEQALDGLASLEPEDANVEDVATAIVDIIELPFGKRPFRVHIDPSNDGSEVVNGMADRVRSEMLRRIGLEKLLSPKAG